MNARTPIALTLLLLLVAFGGFYFLLSPRSTDVVLPVPPVPSVPAPKSADRLPAQPSPGGPAPAAPAAQPSAPPPPPPPATVASMEAEIASSENAELQTLLKANFAGEYNELMTLAAKRRNEGVSGEQFGKELSERVQDIMRPKLKYAVGAKIATIDKLADNEAKLFHALGTSAADLCLKMLGKGDTAAAAQPPADVREMMRLGTLYRFQAIAEGMPNSTLISPLTADDMKSFEESLAGFGLKFDEVRSGEFMSKASTQPGGSCLMLERLYLAISRLSEDTRRKVYAGMFFLGRDK